MKYAIGDEVEILEGCTCGCLDGRVGTIAQIHKLGGYDYCYIKFPDGKVVDIRHRKIRVHSTKTLADCM